MYRRILGVIALLLPAFAMPAAHAQCVSLTSSGVAYTQDFNTLATTGTSTTLPVGWGLGETGTNNNATYTAGTGSGNAGDSYSFGAAGSPERALGGLRSGSLVPGFGACFTNNTGGTLTSLDIAYTGEQWRLGTISRTDQISFQYSTDATSLATGTWNGVAALNFVTPTTATVGAKDGNAAANRTALSATIPMLSIANGATFWIRWADTDASGADDGLAVDDFSLTPQGTVSLPQLTLNDVTLAEGNAGTTSFVFTVSLSAPAPAGGVTFDIATANGTAIAGSDYIAQSLNAQAIPAGSSTYAFTVLVNGDTTPELSENFFVNVTNVANAVVIDGQGQGTLTNDDIAPDLTIADVTQAEGSGGGTTAFTFTVSLSAPAPAGGVTFDIATADGSAVAGSDYTAQSLTAQTIPAGSSSYTFTVQVAADNTGEQNENFLVNVTNATNAIVIDGQASGLIQNDDKQLISAVQGAGTASPFAGQSVIVEGIVTAVHQGASSLAGFYIQEADADADANPSTSEGVFIYTNLAPAAVSVGDRVRVAGTVTEFGTAPNTLTEIVTPTVTVLSSGNPLPAYTDVLLPVAALGDLEGFEGMRVRFTQTLTVSDHANLARFGELTLSANGRVMQPTNVVDPNDDPASGNTSTGASNVAAVNAFINLSARSSIILDDASTQSNPPVIPFLEPGVNTLRLGTTLTNLTGILSQSFGTHRLFADAPPPFAYAPRPASAPAVGGNVRVVSMNVLNYFNGNGAGGGFPTSRGADSLLEFNRQRAKVLAAILGSGADVIGLMEIENDGMTSLSSIQDLIDGLNGMTAPGTWAFVNDPAFVGTDLIRTAMIYRTAAVAPVGSAVSDTNPIHNRPPTAQTFRLLANNEQFTLVVSHLKSKSGSGSGLDADLGDGQAEFNNTRRQQASALLSFLATLGPSARVISMGDYNAYDQEDPMDILRAGGLTNLIPGGYSYLFAGQSGSLDHALVNANLLPAVTGAGKWHINADEPAILDYNVEGKNTTGCTSSCNSPDHYTASPFRASDHDPVVVGLQLLAGQAITFGAQAAQTLTAGGTFALNPLATSSSGLAVTYTSTTPAVCTIAGTTVSMVAAGTCTIAANQAGDANFNPAPQVSQSITINPGAQSITFGAQASQGFVAGGTFALNPPAAASSGLAVSYTSTTTAVCTIAGTSVTIVAAGTCTIAADQAGDANYQAAPQVTQSIAILPAVQTITFGAQAGQVFTAGGTFAINPVATASSGLAVMHGSATPGTCTVAGTTVTILATGTCTLTADQAGNANFQAAPQATQSVAINPGTQSITFPAVAAQTFAPGLTFAVSATASSGLAVTFTSATPAACTVSGATVTVLAGGTCTVNANQAGDANYQAAPQVAQSVTINPGSQAITFVPAVQGATSVTWTVSATASSGLAVTFGTSTPGVCGVTGNAVTFVAMGTCTVTANQGGNASYAAAAQATQALAHSGAQSIAFGTLPSLGLNAAPPPLAATASSGLAVTFASQTASVCSTTGVNGSTLTLTAVGTCTIRASQAGSALYQPAPVVSQSFAVVPSTTGMTLSTGVPVAAYAQPLTLTAMVTGAHPTGRVTFSVGALTGLTTLCADVPLAGGIATCNVPGRFLVVNPVHFVASYAGDAGNRPATVPLIQPVDTNRATLTVTAHPAKPLAGRSVRLTALVRSASLAGPVTFRENGIALAGCENLAFTALPGATDAGVAVCTIAAISAGPHAYVVTYPRAGNAGTEQAMLFVDAMSTPARDYTDMWWAGMGENGWGVSITQHGATQFVVLFVYDGAGKPRWYVMPTGTWNADGTVYTGQAYLPSGSAWSAYDTTRFRANAPVGTITLTYTAADRATLAFTLDGVPGSKAIVRQLFAGDDGMPRLTVNDLWWGGNTQNGWGLNIAQQGRVLFPVWYTYDASGNTTWYTMPGGTWAGTEYRGDLYTATGSPWLGGAYSPAAFAPVKAGTAVINFIDQDNATFTYTVGGVTQTKAIVRQAY